VRCPFSSFWLFFLFRCLVFSLFFFACLGDLLKMLYFNPLLRCFSLSLSVSLLCIHIGRLYMLNPSQNIFLYPPCAFSLPPSYHLSSPPFFYLIIALFFYSILFYSWNLLHQLFSTRCRILAPFLNFLFLALAYSFPLSFPGSFSFLIFLSYISIDRVH
jgi:hypothetical protein